MKKDICHIEMSDDELVKKWLSVFGKGVDKGLIEKHVTSYGNHLWHLFTWGEVPCLQGEEAKRAFDDLEYEEAIRFYDGYASHIEKVSVIGKLSAKAVDKDRGSDVYIVAEDFSWTYVRTHEVGWCGPYFCRRNTEI